MRASSISLIASLLVLVAGAPAAAQPPRAAVERALGGYETRLSRADLEALGAGWEQAVIEVVQDSAARPLLRVRGLSALGFSRDAATGPFLRAAIAARRARSDGPSTLELSQALRSLAVVEGAGAETAIAPYLEHAVPDVRVAAAHALILSKAPRATERVQARLQREREPVARAGLERALKAR